MYDRANFAARAYWTLGANLALLWASRKELRTADEVRFTGAPPYMLHFVMPLAKAFGIRTRYRITDFHPECLIATLGRNPWWLRPIDALTRFWRRRVDVIEVLGEDQRVRLAESGVDPARTELRRDHSPVQFTKDTRPSPPPDGLAKRKIILYSGNWGVAHDYASFLEGYARFCGAHPLVAGLWLNATGSRADLVARELKRRELAYARTRPVPLPELPSVLAAADVHLITLANAFVGYVLPSKVYACVDSRKPVLFIGSARSDVHLICADRLPSGAYRRVDVGDDEGVAQALEHLLLTSI
jgi:hypothetical protein